MSPSHATRFYFSVMQHSVTNKSFCLFRKAANYLEGNGFNSCLEREPRIMKFFLVFNQCTQESNKIATFLKMDQFFTLPFISKRYLLIILYYDSGAGSVVGIATGYGLDGPGIESRLRRDFPHLSRPALRPTHPPVQQIPCLSRE